MGPILALHRHAAHYIYGLFRWDLYKPSGIIGRRWAISTWVLEVEFNALCSKRSRYTYALHLALSGHTSAVLRFVEYKYYIHKNYVIMIPSENGPEFHVVQHVLINDFHSFSIVVMMLHDAFFNEHVMA
ncbi:hypothetical protein PV325_008281 [Microctonus aethiopoides]|uniref:Uncharacterized protein n=1 Tax=Microctonus aethiopoides TaxID=144406 RepID=A0AA39FW04_9HYME|nr:hypothetical protein PV325_008281 [Microctonus aethiopoides]KAK0176879.1 hypothetical protein PV328_000977 [Microctonus aethiopoides]